MIEVSGSSQYWLLRVVAAGGLEVYGVAIALAFWGFVVQPEGCYCTFGLKA